MQRYIQQLIQDFKEAENNPVSEPDFGDSYQEFEKTMLEIEEARYEDSKSVVGVSYEELPPADKMTVQQTQDLLEALLNALAAKGTHVSFPGNGIPVKLAYTEIREQFKKGFHAVPGWNIDFCSGDCLDCAFVNYCSSVTDILTKEELEAARKKTDTQ